MTDYFSAGGHIDDQIDIWDRFAVIVYNNNQFVYSARLWNNNQVSSYICQLQSGLSVMQSYCTEVCSFKSFLLL